ASSGNPNRPYLMGAIVGYRRATTVHAGTPQERRVVTSSVSIGGVTDGMTYTVIAGEKHIPGGFLGHSYADFPMAASIAVHSDAEWTSNKIIGLGLPPRPDDPAFVFDNPLPNRYMT